MKVTMHLTALELEALLTAAKQDGNDLRGQIIKILRATLIKRGLLDG